MNPLSDPTRCIWSPWPLAPGGVAESERSEVGTVWRKSSRSQDQTLGCCVELAQIGAVRGIRDSKHPEGPHLRFSPRELRTFFDTLK